MAYPVTTSTQQTKKKYPDVLWRPPDTKKLIAETELVRDAVDFYKDKYGARPNFCLMHRSAKIDLGEVDGVKMTGVPNIQTGHFLLGVD